ncbi:MAG: phytoene desaturase family protein [Chloroflexota bacterium]|nr:phytoene desaturase family protein [Chloroflexota bacterium]
MSTTNRLTVIGAGFSGLAAAALLANDGWDVTVLEKNAQVGGAARAWNVRGFTFDMGPTWYLIPEVFERYFALFGERREAYYDLTLLNPSYRVFFEDGEQVDITPDIEQTKATFERFEPGGADKLTRFLEHAAYRYDTAMKEFLYREYRSIFDFFNRRLLVYGARMNLFRSLDREVSSYFTDDRAKKILEYAMVFLGSSPFNARALYSIMAHVDLNLGVWYPGGGMGSVVDGVRMLAESRGVMIRTGEQVRKLSGDNGTLTYIVTEAGEYPADVVVASADYPHVETELLERSQQSYPLDYWRKRVVAPSMFLIFLGLTKKVEALTHHNLYLANRWEEHFASIFDNPDWPKNPSYYIHCPSQLDKTLAPEGHEIVVIGVPVAPGLDDSDSQRQEFAEQAIKHLEKLIGTELRDSIVVQRIFSHRDFKNEYNLYRGTAFGLSHTLLQTAVFRPSYRSRKIKNLYFTGQYTHPGIGVPMSFISSQVVAEKIRRERR